MDREFVGKVVEITSRKRAIVAIQLDGKTVHATMMYNKFKIDGKSLPRKGTLYKYLQKNTQLILLAQPTHSQGTRNQMSSLSIRSARPLVYTTEKQDSEVKKTCSEVGESLNELSPDSERSNEQLGEAEKKTEIESQKQLNDMRNEKAQRLMQSFTKHELELEKVFKAVDALNEMTSEVQALVSEEMKQKVALRLRLVQLESENMDLRQQLNEAKKSENQALDRLQGEVREFQMAKLELENSNEKLLSDLEQSTVERERQRARILNLEMAQKNFNKVLADVEATSLQMTNTLQRIAECPICLEVLKYPLTICTNGHSICSSCTKELRLDMCPTCRTTLTVGPVTPIFLKDLLTALV